MGTGRHQKANRITVLKNIRREPIIKQIDVRTTGRVEDENLKVTRYFRFARQCGTRWYAFFSKPSQNVTRLRERAAAEPWCVGATRRQDPQNVATVAFFTAAEPAVRDPV